MKLKHWVAIILIVFACNLVSLVVIFRWRENRERQRQEETVREAGVKKFAELSADLAMLDLDLTITQKHINSWKESSLLGARDRLGEAMVRKHELESRRPFLKRQIRELSDRLGIASR